MIFRKKDKTINFNIPTTWNELNPWQRNNIASLVYRSKNGDTGIFFAVIYYLFVSQPWWTWKGLKENRRFLYFTQQVPIRQYMQYADFIFKDLNLTKFPRYVKIKDQKFYGPADRLANLTMEELAITYQFYFNWIVNKSDIDLDRLIVALYRPYSKKTIGDVREAFSEHTMIERSGILPKIKVEQKIAIGFAYKSSTELIFSRYKELFPPPKSSKKKEDAKPKFTSFVPMMRMMAMGEDKPLGDYEKVRKTNVNMFFDIAQETVRLERKRQLELAKLKRK